MWPRARHRRTMRRRARAGAAPHPGRTVTEVSAAPARSLISLSSLVKVYDTGEVPFTALRGIDLTVDSGEFVGLIGKSGSGKTTLINMITGIDRPTSGKVVVGGTPVHTLSENRVAIWRG